MKTIACIITITAVMGVVLSAGAFAAPPAGGRELCFELVDRTVISGRIDAKTIAFRISGGSVLKIPVMELLELRVGLNDRPGLVQRVEALVKAMDSDSTRQDAMRQLLAFGPSVEPIVKRYAASDVPVRHAAVGRVLEAYKTWAVENIDAPRIMAGPRELRSTLQAGGSIFIGAVTVKQFRVASPYGPVTVKLDDIHRIRPAVRATPGKLLGPWGVKFRDGTYLAGRPISPLLRVQTRYGPVGVPYTRLQQAAIAPDGKTFRLLCWGSDRIIGALGPDSTIPFKTDKGRVDVPVGKIAKVAYGFFLKRAWGTVHSVAFSPDGKRLASGRSDKVIKIWDMVAGKQLLVLKGHSDKVWSVAFSPDGKRLASASSDRTIKIWDTVTGKQLLTLKGHLREVGSVAFSPDGKSLASGSWDNTIRLWDSADGTELFTLKGHSKVVRSVAFSPDGKSLASGSSDHTVKLWDPAAGKLKGHFSGGMSVAFSLDGKALATGNCEDNTIKLWDTVTGKKLIVLDGYSEHVLSIAFSPDGKHLASGHSSGVRLWDAATGKQLVMLSGHVKSVWSAVFSPDGKSLVSGSSDNTIKIWNLSEWTKAPK